MRILLIEDDRSIAPCIELMLNSESFDVCITELGEEGVGLGKLSDHDIILLDLNLPDISGFQVLRTLRNCNVTTPVLILSALASVETTGLSISKTSGELPCWPASSAWVVSAVVS